MPPASAGSGAGVGWLWGGELAVVRERVRLVMGRRPNPRLEPTALRARFARAPRCGSAACRSAAEETQ